MIAPDEHPIGAAMRETPGKDLQHANPPREAPEVALHFLPQDPDNYR
jgi:hypothetical protein